MFYLMQVERDREVTDAEEGFKNLVFANNPKLYEAVFSPQPQANAQGIVVNPNPDDLVVPETVGDIANLLSDLKELGVPVGDTKLPD